MQRDVVGIVVLCSVLLGACASDSRVTELRAEQSQAIDRLLDGQMKDYRIPGMAIAVIRNGVVVKKSTLGDARVSPPIAVADTTPFQLASTTKTFAASAALLLVGDAKLKLSDLVGDLLEGLPPDWQNTTVRQLLSHTSGLPDITRQVGQLDLIADRWENALPLIAKAPRQFVAGDKWLYTQTNYVLLARIVEKVTGTTLEKFLNDRVFQPAGMKNAFYPMAGDSTRTCATNYERVNGGEPTTRQLTFPPYVHAAGGLCASLSDLIAWNLSLDSNRVLKPELTRELWAATTLNDRTPARVGGSNMSYGLGWVVDDTPGHRTVGHSGGNSTAYRRYIDDDITIIVLHNGVLDPDGLITSIASIVTRQPGDAGPSAQERLWDAAMSGDTSEILRALKDGADIEKLDTRKSTSGRRALNWAAWFNRADAVGVLLREHAAIDAVNKTGFTALHHAAENGSQQAVDVLLAKGANRTLVNRNGEKPADTATREGHAAVAASIEGSSSKRE